MKRNGQLNQSNMGGELSQTNEIQGSPSQYLRNTMSDFSRTNTESNLYIGGQNNFSEQSPGGSPSKY